MKKLWNKIGWVILTIAGSFNFGAGYAIFLGPNGLNAGGISALSAVIVALLVHLMLLLLFRQAPVTSDAQLDNKAFITQLELNSTGNQELAKWVQLHDPALMVSSDRRSGFSSVLASVSKPPQLDDLPLPPSLSVPRSPVLNDFQCSLAAG